LRQRFLEAGNMAAFTSGRLSSMLQIDDRQISRLTRLIDDMLDVSRVNMGKLSMNFETVDLRTVLEEALERFSPQLAEIGCEVVLDPNPSVFVSGDRFRLEQVMINLLTNAQKYGAGKPIRIELMKEDGKARLMVQDRGRGIAKENQERIFSRFERAVSANEISGLGLGLYIVRQILDAHSGRVWVESELKQGAKFFMELPLAGESRIL